MADPDLELRGGGGLDLLAMVAIFLSVISSFFTQNKGGGAGPPGPSPRSAIALYKRNLLVVYFFLTVCSRVIFKQLKHKLI